MKKPTDRIAYKLLLESLAALTRTPGFRYEFGGESRNSTGLCYRIEQNFVARGIDPHTAIKRAARARQSGRKLH